MIRRQIMETIFFILTLILDIIFVLFLITETIDIHFNKFGSYQKAQRKEKKRKSSVISSPGASNFSYQ